MSPPRPSARLAPALQRVQRAGAALQSEGGRSSLAKLALLAAFGWPGAATLALAAGGAVLALQLLRRAAGAGQRVEHLLTLAAFLFLALYQLPVLRGAEGRAEPAAAALAEAMAERLEQDARLLGEVTRRVPADLSPADADAAFGFLAQLSRDLPLDGRGLKLFQLDGRLVAWYGQTLDPTAGAQRVPLATGKARAWLSVDGKGAGVVLRSDTRSWLVALEDPWLRRSPVEALGLPRTGWLAQLERRRGVRVDFDQAGMRASAAQSASTGGVAAGAAKGAKGGDVIADADESAGAGDPEPGATAPLGIAGRRIATVGPLQGVAGLGVGTIWLQLAAVCYLIALALLIRRAWCAIESRLRGDDEHGADALDRWPLGLGLKACLLLAFRWVLVAGSFLPTLFPGRLSSALSFASPALGPFASSPADLLMTGLLILLLALDAFLTGARAVRRGRPRAPSGRWRAAWPAVALLVLLGLGILVQPGLRRAGGLLIRDTSTELLLRQNLYSSPEGAFLFAGFAALAAAFMLILGLLFVLAARAAGRAGASSGGGRMWPWALAAALLLVLAAAAHLQRSAPDISPSFLTILLWALGVSVGCALADIALAPEFAERRWTRLVLAPALLLGLFSGAAAVTAHGSGRVWGFQQFMADQLDTVGQPSNQWLEYNVRITGQRLVGAGAELGVLGYDEEAAAFVTWTRAPLRELPFPSALVLTDAEGSVRSRFSVLPPGDLELLPWIARAALRAAPGEVNRVQTETGRGLFFTAVPLGASPAGLFYAVAILSEALEPSATDESAAYFLRDIFSAEPADPFLFAVHRGEPVPSGGRGLTLASGSGESRRWISLPLDRYLPDPLDYLSLCLTILAGAFAFLILYQRFLGVSSVPWPRGWRNPLATFRGRIFSVLLAFVALPILVYSWISFQTTRHEIEHATRALAEEALRAAAAFLGPRLETGGVAELESVLPEAARVIGQDLIVYRGGEVQGSNRPEIFQANLFSRRMPGELYRRLAFAGERLATERERLGAKDVLVAYLRTPWSGGGAPYMLASPLLLRGEHISQDLRHLLQILFVIFALSLVAMGIFSWLVSRQLSSPLAALKEGADRIALGELDYRLRGPERSDEFNRLYSAFNTMAAGLQVSRGELLAEKGRIQAILSSTGAGVIALDREGRVQLANQAARDLLGLPQEVAGRHAAELPPEPFWERVARALQLESRREDEVRLGAAGAGRTLHLVFAPLRGEGGERRGLVVVFEDISGIVASQRMLAWEEMARQVAHEIKNPLTPIKLSLQHLHRLQHEPPEDFAAVLERNLDLVLSEIGRLERIAGEFSRFGMTRSRAEPMAPEPTLKEVVELYAQQGQEALRFELAVRGRPVPVLAEHDGLKKILVNLLENAREAMDGGRDGRNTVRVELDYDASPEQALLRVRDEGRGISPEDLHRLFHPYFSTKTRGTGLGLAIARRIVESWGGTIEARNWDEGAEVLLWLGKSPAPA